MSLPPVYYTFGLVNRLFFPVFVQVLNTLASGNQLSSTRSTTHTRLYCRPFLYSTTFSREDSP